MLVNKIENQLKEVETTLNQLKEIQALNEVLNELDKRAMEKIAQYMK